MAQPILLAVPNVSEGRDVELIAAIGKAFACGEPTAGRKLDTPDPRNARSAAARPGQFNGTRLLDVHSDEAHHRSVFTLAARQGELADALLRGARAAVAKIDVMSDRGREEVAADEPQPSATREHPYVGAVDVVPVVYVEERTRGAACAEALVVADRIGDELEVPVFLYGELSGGEGRPARTRAELRRGGVAGLAARMSAPDAASVMRPDFGPPVLHPTAGATLVAAREPLVAFNLELAPPATVADAHRIAALIREGGAEGLPGVRAIGVRLANGVAQVSMNLERPLEVPVAAAIEAVRRHAPVKCGELVGLAPRWALEGLPEDVPLAGFDPARHLIENALGS